jgi:hypothetical protein
MTRILRYRYSVRALMAAVLVCCVGFAFGAHRLQRYRSQQSLLAHILSCGGRSAQVGYDYQLDYASYRIGGPSPPGPSWLRRYLGKNFFAEVVLIQLGTCPHVPPSRLNAFPRLEYVYIRNRAVSQDDLRVLTSLEHLRCLEMGATNLDDAGLRILSAARSLNGLWLDHTAVCDATPLTALTDLSELDLSGTRVCDVSFVAHLPNLRTLSLADTPVENIDALSASQLTEIDLSGTRVTDLSPLTKIGGLTYVAVANLPGRETGIQQLRHALPECAVLPRQLPDPRPPE